MLIPLLTEYEKTQIGERQPLPERYLGLYDEEMDRRERAQFDHLPAPAAFAARLNRLVVRGL